MAGTMTARDDRLQGLPEMSYWPADHTLDIPALTLPGLLREAARDGDVGVIHEPQLVR